MKLSPLHYQAGAPMLRKVELDALRADLAAVEGILAEMNTDEDPVGHYQFEARKREIEREIAKVSAAPEHTASVGLYFAGEPVIGSKGIRADFAGKAMAFFQDMVAKKYAALEAGVLGRRGPVALRARTDMMLTDVMRGSIGLVLQEVEETGSLVDSKLRPVIDEVTDIVSTVAAPDDVAVDEVLGSIDTRFLSSLGDFFRLLDDQGATVRLVEGEREETLDRAAVRRARARTDAVLINEIEAENIEGRLYLLPEHRRFELQRDDNGETIYGTVSADFSTEHLRDIRDNADVVGRKWRTKLRIREVRRQNRPPKVYYTLLGLIGRVS